MTRRQTRLFFAVGTTIFAAIFVGLTVHSHTRFAELTHEDAITPWLPFDVTKAIHTNLLIVWVLTGFMGGAYWLVPEESRTELHSPKMAYGALILWTLAGVTAVVGYLFGWTAGNKLLEQPLPVKLAIVVVMLMFLYNLGMTIWKARRLTTTEGILMAGSRSRRFCICRRSLSSTTTR
jgi:nitric oxide reductase subunit B